MDLNNTMPPLTDCTEKREFWTYWLIARIG